MTETKKTKNKRIGQTRKETAKRHSMMDCKTYEVKVVSSKMSKKQREQVNQLFREAKWRKNDLIADFNNADRNAKSAKVKVGDAFEERKFEILGSQMVQDLYDETKTAFKSLKTKKENGEKVGSLKFKSYCNSVPLRQYGVTFKINFSRNRISVQKIKKDFYVRGLKQIPEDAEISNAKFIRKASGLYFNITCFVPHQEKEKTGKQSAADFGIGNNLTLTDGRTMNVCFAESKGTKLASRRLNKALAHGGNKKSHNHFKRRAKLRKAYEKDVNRRHDAGNKIVHEVLDGIDFFAIQDEMIHNWHAGWFGKEVQHSAMGYIKARLKNDRRVHVVERSYPSTQLCPVCGKLTKHPLEEREYNCQFCGYHNDSRDQKSAMMILLKAVEEQSETLVSPEQRAQSPSEVSSSVGLSLDNPDKNIACDLGSPAD